MTSTTGSQATLSIWREIGLGALLAMLVFGPSLIAGQGGPVSQGAGALPDLVTALRATPGCLGVETARTSGGKQVIFAWFENKKAVLNWYYSAVHQRVAHQFFPNQPGGRTPLADLPDDGQPVLTIASLTMSEKPVSDATTLPVSQIAIELYRPLPGGLSLGGRFAPEALKVPGLIDILSPAAANR